MFGKAPAERRGTGSLMRTPHRMAETTPLLSGQDGIVQPTPERAQGFVALGSLPPTPPITGGLRPRRSSRSAPQSCCTAAVAWVYYRCCEAAEKVGTALAARRFAVSCGALLVMTALERVTFKLSVDRMAPFRSFLAETVVFMYICICGMMLAYKLAFTEQITKEMWTFPQWQIASIAAVDALHLFLMFVSGADISPAQTVLLLQLQVPLVMLVSGTMRCRCAELARSHLLGSAGVVLSVIIAALSPLWFANGKHPLSDEAARARLYATVTYVLAAVPSAASTVLKEKAMINFGRPMEPVLMNVMLAGYQMLFSLMLSPLAFRLQSLGHPATEYPWEQLQTATNDGLRCWLLSRDPPEGRYVFDTMCSGAYLIIFAYALAVLSLPSVAAAVLTSGNVRYVYRTVIIATGVSVLVLAAVLGGHDGLLGTSLQPLELISLVLLLASLLLYHQEQEPETEIITQYEHYSSSPPPGAAL